MAKAKKVGHSWSKRYRKVGGHRRLVKVRKVRGREQVRIIGVKNRVDKSAKRLGLRRRKGFYNSTDSGHRMHRI